MKGVSPLVAAVLLIAFTVAVSMIVMGWFSTFVRGTTANISGTTEEAIGCNVASISIEHVYISGTTGTIVVKNTGFKDFTSVSAMIVNTTGGACSVSGQSLAKGEVKALTLSDCHVSDASKFDRAIVTTECGGVSDTVTSTSYVTVS